MQPTHPPPPSHEHDSEDSDNDPDFVPDDAKDSDSSDEERSSKRPRQDTSRTQHKQLTEDEVDAKKKAREALWADFQASVASSGSKSVDSATVTKLVKIEKRYRFAGEDVIEVKEVPENSEEAHKWPLWRPPSDGSKGIDFSGSRTLDAKSTSPSFIPPLDATPTTSSSTTPTTITQPTASDSTSAPNSVAIPTYSSINLSTPTTATTPAPPARKPPPGRRKPKVQLSDLPSSSKAKAKKLTTLEKSSMDWKNHVGTGPSELQDELEANKRAGGYLEKVSFLQRVDERKEEVLEASKDRKRRRG